MSASHGLCVTTRGEVRGWSMWNIANRLENCRAEREMLRNIPIRDEKHLKRWLRGKLDVTEREITEANDAFRAPKTNQTNMNTPRTDKEEIYPEEVDHGRTAVYSSFARELETELEAVKATLRGSRAPRIYEENEKLKAIIRSVKSYPFVPQGLVAMVEKMEAGK